MSKFIGSHFAVSPVEGTQEYSADILLQLTSDWAGTPEGRRDLKGAVERIKMTLGLNDLLYDQINKTPFVDIIKTLNDPPRKMRELTVENESEDMIWIRIRCATEQEAQRTLQSMRTGVSQIIGSTIISGVRGK